jgi:hypothetical protein
VNRLRDDVLPPFERKLGTEVYVTGIVGDFANVLSVRLPYFFLAVLTLSFLLLMVVFRSLLVPLKAVIMNVLSIGASYGIVVAVFQWGWLTDLVGVSRGPIEPWASSACRWTTRCSSCRASAKSGAVRGTAARPSPTALPRRPRSSQLLRRS